MQNQNQPRERERETTVPCRNTTSANLIAHAVALEGDQPAGEEETPQERSGAADPTSTTETTCQTQRPASGQTNTSHHLARMDPHGSS